MSTSRGLLDQKIREHFNDRSDTSVEILLSRGIARVNGDIESSYDLNRKKRLKAIRAKLLQWQTQLVSFNPELASDFLSSTASRPASSSHSRHVSKGETAREVTARPASANSGSSAAGGGAKSGGGRLIRELVKPIASEPTPKAGGGGGGGRPIYLSGTCPCCEVKFLNQSKFDSKGRDNCGGGNKSCECCKGYSLRCECMHDHERCVYCGPNKKEDIQGGGGDSMPQKIWRFLPTADNKPGGRYCFLGKSQKLGLENSFSVMCWINIHKFNKTDQNDNAIIGQMGGASNAALHLLVRDRKLHFGFYGNDTAGVATLEENTWYHVCFSYDEKTQTQSIYLNCKLDNQSAQHPPLRGNGDTYVAHWYATGARCLNGDIADLKVIPEALASNEKVFEHMTNQHPIIKLYGAEVSDKDETMSNLIHLKTVSKKRGSIPVPRKVGSSYYDQETLGPLNCSICFTSFEDGEELADFCALRPASGAHKRFHMSCMKLYLEERIDSGYVGSCPHLLCVEVDHVGLPPSKRVILPYKKWSKALPEAKLQKYKNFAESFMMFLCGSCHQSKSQLVPFDETFKNHASLKTFLLEKYSSSNGLHRMTSGSFQCPQCRMMGPSEESGPQKCSLCNLCTVCCSKSQNRTCARAPKKVVDPNAPVLTPFADLDAFVRSLTDYELGLSTAAQFYDEIFTVHLSCIKSEKNYKKVFEGLGDVLCLIGDPERRATLQLMHLNKNPKFDTICCGYLHCFRCKVKNFHEGVTCAKNMEGMDSSVLPCPNCFIMLSKGDGCDSVYCVCGNRISWSTELAKYNEITKFAVAFPNDTVEICADILCGTLHGSERNFADNQLNASKWRIHNQAAVDKAILSSWQKRFPYSHGMIARISLDEDMEKRLNVNSIVKTVWSAVHKAKVDKAIKDIDICRASLLDCLYPSTLEKHNALAYFAKFVTPTNSDASENNVSVGIDPPNDWSRIFGEDEARTTSSASDDAEEKVERFDWKRLNSDEVEIFEKLKKFKESVAGKAKFLELQCQITCNSALRFLEMYGTDKVSSSHYKITPVKDALLESVKWSGPKVDWAVGDRVILSENYASYSDAARGPLKRGKVGVITQMGGMTGNRVCVDDWWYDKPALLAESQGSVEMIKSLLNEKDNEFVLKKFYTSRGKSFTPLSTSGSISSSSSGGGGGSTSSAIAWNCIACTFLNSGSRSECEVCTTKKQEVVLTWSVGEEVVLSSSYKAYDGSDGPLKPGEVGIIVETDSSQAPYKVKGDNGSFWYKEAALELRSKRSSAFVGDIKTLNTFHTKLYFEFRRLIKAIQDNNGKVPYHFRSMLMRCPGQGRFFCRGKDGAFIVAKSGVEVSKTTSLCTSARLSIIKNRLGQEKCGTQLGHLRLKDQSGTIIPASAYTLTAAGDLRNGREHLSNLSNTATEDWNKWLHMPASSTWVQFDFKKPTKISSYGMCSANDCPERDPDQFELQIRSSSDGEWEILHQVKTCPFSSRWQWFWFDLELGKKGEYVKNGFAYSGGIINALVAFVKGQPSKSILSDGLAPFYDSNEEVEFLRQLKIWKLTDAIKMSNGRLKTVTSTEPKHIEKNLFKIVYAGEEVAVPVAGGGKEESLADGTDLDSLLRQITWKDYFYDLVGIDRYKNRSGICRTEVTHTWHAAWSNEQLRISEDALSVTRYLYYCNLLCYT